MQHVLFVCSQNRLRSPTAEQVFSGWPGVEVLSAGTNNDAVTPITPELVQWADKIIVMDSGHRNKVRKKFRALINGKPVISLGIPDEYDYMDPALVAILEKRVPPFLG